MKIKLILMMVLISSICLSQKRISYVSCDKDTVLLPNNELGMRLYTSWFDIKETERPVILLATEKYIDEKNNIKFINYPLKKDDDIIVYDNIFQFILD